MNLLNADNKPIEVTVAQVANAYKEIYDTVDQEGLSRILRIIEQGYMFQNDTVFALPVLAKIRESF